MLEPEGEQCFLHLAAEGLVAGEEEILGELLRQGGAAARIVAGDLADDGGSDAHRIEAEMAHKAPVFNGDHGRRYVVRQFLQRNGFAARLAAVGHQLAVGGEHLDVGRSLRTGPGVR